MSDEARKGRRPTTDLPPEVIREISYRAYLARLEPPMTAEQSETTVTKDVNGKPVTAETRRHRASCMDVLTRTYVRVLTEQGLIQL